MWQIVGSSPSRVKPKTIKSVQNNMAWNHGNVPGWSDLSTAEDCCFGSSWHYKDPTKRVGLIQKRHHHQLVLVMIQLTNYSLVVLIAIETVGMHGQGLQISTCKELASHHSQQLLHTGRCCKICFKYKKPDIFQSLW